MIISNQERDWLITKVAIKKVLVIATKKHNQNNIE